MRDGSRYNGCFNSKLDLEVATAQNNNPDDPEAMAHFYGVPLEDYLAGQEWARENLPSLRREAGLDPNTGLPAPPTNGTAQQPEEPQSAAPSISVPLAPVVPTQSLLSFTVRRLIGLFWPFGL